MSQLEIIAKAQLIASLNSWVAMNMCEELVIPDEVLEPLFQMTDWQSRNA